MSRVTTAERAGGTSPSQDRIFTTEQAVIVLDGASHPESNIRDGGWLADQLGRALHHVLSSEPSVDLRAALAEAIASTADHQDLQVGACPTTTVSIVRWNDTAVDVLVLCDSPVVVTDLQGTPHEVRDRRLHDVSRRLDRPEGFLSDDRDGWRVFVDCQQEQRNITGGFWVAEADPAAAYEAIAWSGPVDDVAAILAMTDGVSVGVDVYGVPATWAELLGLAVEDPMLALDSIHTAEEGDPDGVRWPRGKRHDDKALAVVRFQP